MTKAEIEHQINLLKYEALKLECKKSLRLYTRAMWDVIEPSTVYKHNWHIDAICEHLEAVSKFQIKKLVIMTPPRNMKSITASVMWPSWVWANNPERKFIYGSYAQSLAIQDAIKMRDIVRSPKFAEYFRPSWTLREDMDTKARFENTAGGHRISTSVGGIVTGLGGDFIVGDDLVNVKEAHSEAARVAANEFWLKTLLTRANDPEKSARVLIMQRVHELDPAGAWIAEQGDVEFLRLPAEYNKKLVSFTSLNFKDPREKEGELLWPTRFNEDAIKTLKKGLGSLDANAQLQQDPKPADGGLFKRQWWKKYREAPTQFKQKVQFWDCAQKAGISNDWTVCATWGQTDNGYYLLDLLRIKAEAPQIQAAIKAQFDKHKPNAVVIEDKSSGSSMIQFLKFETTIPVLPFDPGQRDKVVRAMAATPTVEAGNCYLPERADWVDDFLSEHEKFPNAAHDDIVDTTSMAVEFFIYRPRPQPRIRSL